MSEPAYVCLMCPYPPSVNGLFAGKARRRKSAPYLAWIEQAGKELLTQCPLPTFSGPYGLILSFGRPDKRKRDLGNLEKAVSDLLVEHGIVEDDSLAERIVLQWADNVTGCRIEVCSFERALGVPIRAEVA